MAPLAPESSSERTGIAVVVVLTVIRVVLIALGLLVAFGRLEAGGLQPYLPIPIYPVETDRGLIVAAALAGMLIVSVLAIIGLLQRLEWGWTLAIVTAGISLALNIGWWLAGEPHYLSMLTNAVVVFYLNQRDVREAFGVHG
jgi:hypothetical protein